MKKGTLLVLNFLARLAGFITGGLPGWVVGWFLVELINGGPLRNQQGLIMLLVGLIGFLAGGLTGIILAGKWTKASSPQDSQSERGGTPPPPS